VVRAELSPEDANPKNCGIAVSFDHYRFI
jgi:hypothetical protein